MSGFVTRFAPSPTGHLHKGHAFSALTAHKAAAAAGGRFLLRVEDIDFTRCRPQFEAAILEDLAWLGLTWEAPVLRQSEHLDHYRATLEPLISEGLVYRCFRTRREVLDAMSSAPHGRMEGFRGAPAENLPALREDTLALLRSNNQLLQAARNEPSGGPGWREGLNMLSQFGHSLYDVLVALEFSVKDSHEDGYAQQLEPALGRLAVDIRTGFHHVAACIHGWRFHIPPPGLNLEEDIVQLEVRMNAARPKGIEFSQAEILRAYAVQLHLKQIARLLRASRVETCRAIGGPQE